MNMQLFSVYVSAVVLLCLTPGPNSLLAISNGLRYGVRKTFFSSLGCSSGLILLIAICLSGLGFVISTSESAFAVIKWCGAGYLIYLGISLVRSKASLTDTNNRSTKLQERSNLSLFVQGFLVIVTNPKVLLFFTAFLPQFYIRDSSFWSQFAVLAGTFVVIEFVIEMCLASFAGRIQSYTNSAPRVLNRLSGSLFISAGVFLITLERPR